MQNAAHLMHSIKDITSLYGVLLRLEACVKRTVYFKSSGVSLVSGVSNAFVGALKYITLEPQCFPAREIRVI